MCTRQTEIRGVSLTHARSSIACAGASLRCTVGTTGFDKMNWYLGSFSVFFLCLCTTPVFLQYCNIYDMQRVPKSLGTYTELEDAWTPGLMRFGAKLPFFRKSVIMCVLAKTCGCTAHRAAGAAIFCTVQVRKSNCFLSFPAMVSFFPVVRLMRALDWGKKTHRKRCCFPPLPQACVRCDVWRSDHFSRERGACVSARACAEGPPGLISERFKHCCKRPHRRTARSAISNSHKLFIDG